MSSEAPTKDELIAEARTLATNIQGSWYALGHILNLLLPRCKLGEFPGLCAEIGLTHRVARYLMLAERRFRQAEIPPPDDIPWRTLAEAAKAINWVESKAILDYCRTHTREEVRAAVKAKRFG